MVLTNLVFNASSFDSNAGLHISLIRGLLNAIMSFSRYGRASRRGVVNNIKTCDIIQPKSGVFVWFNRALIILSLSNLPLGLTLSISKRFVDFTASSDLPLKDRRLTDEMLYALSLKEIQSFYCN